MGFALNFVAITGNMTRDPELKVIGTDSSVCEFGIAYNMRFKGSDGQWTSRACFFDVKVWGAQGERLAQYGHKGMPITVAGHLDQRSWEAPDGGKRTKVEIVANDLVYDSKEQSTEGPHRASRAEATAAPQSMMDDFKDIDFGGDDIPF